MMVYFHLVCLLWVSIFRDLVERGMGGMQYSEGSEECDS